MVCSENPNSLQLVHSVTNTTVEPRDPSGDARRQHYNPRLLQRGFATERKPGKHQIWVFDKQTGRRFCTATENVAAERDFNTIDVGDYSISWENKLTFIEDMAAPVIDQIRKSRSIADLEPMQRGALCVFAAVQMIRGPDWRARFTDIGNLIKAKVAGEATAELLPWLEGEGDEDTQARVSSARALQHNLSEFADQFAAKDMILFEAPKDAQFMLGDSPVALTHRKTFGPYGNLGLAVAGIEIYLPIGSKLTVGFWCPTHVAGIRARLTEGETALRSQMAIAAIGATGARDAAQTMVEAMRAARKTPEAIVRAFHDGAPLLCDVDNVMHMNALQIRSSERFVMSRTNDFALERMIADDDNNRYGRRMTV